MRPFMQTFTGRRFFPLAPRVEDICIEDIAHGLAFTCRYGGMAHRFYSVSQHCVLVMKRVEKIETIGRTLAAQALLHDSAEAYIGDMIRPLKHQPEMEEFRKAEAAIERVVFERFNVSPTGYGTEVIKEVDDRIVLDEVQLLMRDPSMYLEHHPAKTPLGIRIRCWSPERAEEEYLYHAKRLGIK